MSWLSCCRGMISREGLTVDWRMRYPKPSQSWSAQPATTTPPGHSFLAKVPSCASAYLCSDLRRAGQKRQQLLLGRTQDVAARTSVLLTLCCLLRESACCSPRDRGFLLRCLSLTEMSDTDLALGCLFNSSSSTWLLLWTVWLFGDGGQAGSQDAPLASSGHSSQLFVQDLHLPARLWGCLLALWPKLPEQCARLAS